MVSIRSLGGRGEAGAEAVHPDRAAALHQPAQVVEVRRVAGVADHDAGEVDALGGEDALLVRAGAGERVAVRHDRDAARAMRERDGAQLQFVVGAVLLGGDLERAGTDARAGDADVDVVQVELHNGVRRPAAEVVRHPEVHARGGDDVQLRPLRHLRHQADVAREVHGRHVDDRVDARRARLLAEGGGGGDLGLAVEELRVVGVERGRLEEEVLVHQREAERARLQLAAQCGNRRHVPRSSRCAAHGSPAPPPAAAGRMIPATSREDSERG